MKHTTSAPLIDFKIRLDRRVFALIRRLAFERKVYTSQLIRDVLHLWTLSLIDPQDPLYQSDVTGFNLPPPPAERLPGYLDSLGFSGEDAVCPPIAEYEGHWNKGF